MFKYFIILILAFFQVSVNHMMVSQNISNSNFQFKQEFLHFVGSNEKCVVVGENDEYVFAVVYPWNNTPEETDRRNGLTAKGYPVSGLYTNDEEKKPIYQLPELRKVYDIQVSFDGEEVWLISNQLINLSSDKNADGTVPIISYYKNGKCIYNILLTDLYNEEDFVNFPGDDRSKIWYQIFDYSSTYFEFNMLIPTEKDLFNSKPIKVDRYTGEISGFSKRTSYPQLFLIIVIAIGILAVVMFVIIVSKMHRIK